MRVRYMHSSHLAWECTKGEQLSIPITICVDRKGIQGTCHKLFFCGQVVQNLCAECNVHRSHLIEVVIKVGII